MPERGGGNNLNPRPNMVSLRDALLGRVKDASLLLMAAIVLVLLIACTNLANLLMARTAERAAELSVRAALGASRARLARQLLTECLLLSSVAAVAGLLVAFWTTSLAAKVEPPPLGAQSYSTLNGPVLIFTVLASVVTAVLSGVLPLLYVARIPPGNPLPKIGMDVRPRCDLKQRGARRIGRKGAGLEQGQLDGKAFDLLRQAFVERFDCPFGGAIVTRGVPKKCVSNKSRTSATPASSTVRTRL